MKTILSTALATGWCLGQTILTAPAAAQLHEDDHADHAAADHPDHAQDDHAGHDHAQDAGESALPAGAADAHAGHDHEDGAIELSAEVLAEFGVRIQPASGGAIDRTVRLPGEVLFNGDTVAHVTPTVAGIVNQVHFSVGDRVEAGDTMAVLNSRELAAARSQFLAARARLALAEENLRRDRRLFESKIGSERAVLESTQAEQEARIALQQAENTLHAIGYSHQQIEAVTGIDESGFNLYQLTAPLSGMVTRRHLTLGEVVEPGADAPFVVADLSTVWVNLTVYQRDLAHVRAGQRVRIQFGHGIPDAEASVQFVSPSLDESTRTAFARVVLDNPDGVWRPGLFVTGEIDTGREQAAVVVPRSAVIGLDDAQVVFVETAHGLAPREITLGRVTEDRAEVVSGLRPGDRYAFGNVLVLKAELNRGALEHAGHAH